MKIVTWNVNSLRVRLPHVSQFIELQQPDVLALQEIKMETSQFPFEVFKEMGYHAEVNGQKTYNGVATLSREVMCESEMSFSHFADPQRRLLATTVNNIRIINVYVPNGEAIDSPKYVYKLEWLEHLATYLTDQLQRYEKVVVLGDFNIAPADEDVYAPDVWQDQVLCSTSERHALQHIFDLGLKDSFRLFPQPEKSFSWWDYRRMAFRRNAGLRIDHVLLSETLSEMCTGCLIDKVPRKWERPSDHAPVVCALRA